MTYQHYNGNLVKNQGVKNMQLSNEKLVELIQGNIFPIDHMERLYLQNKPLMVRIIKRMVGDVNSDYYR